MTLGYKSFTKMSTNKASSASNKN
ncbi:MAG: hypothetical protein RL385_3442, partial [Pseudomonadota bacterium]